MGETTNQVSNSTTDLSNPQNLLDNADVYAAALAQEADSTADDNDSPAAIEARIEQTRSHMGETIDALQDKLNPEKLTHQVTETVKEQIHENIQSAKDTVREATIGKAEELMHNASETVQEVTRPVVEAVGRATESMMGSAQSAGATVAHSAADTGAAVKHTTTSIFDTMRENPLATALAAVGIGMLLAGSSRGSSSSAGSQTNGYRSRYSGENSATSSGQSAVGHVAEAASDLKHQVQSKAENIAAGTINKVQDLGEQASRQQHVAQDRLSETIQQNPLAAGAIALAVGAAIGLMVPSTEPEKQLLGDTGGKIIDKAQDVVHETADKVKDVAGRAVEGATTAVAEAAKEHGFTS